MLGFISGHLSVLKRCEMNSLRNAKFSRRCAGAHASGGLNAVQTLQDTEGIHMVSRPYELAYESPDVRTKQKPFRTRNTCTASLQCASACERQDESAS